MSARPAAVVFDCDGLLIDSEVRWAVAERRVVEAHGGEHRFASGEVEISFAVSRT